MNVQSQTKQARTELDGRYCFSMFHFAQTKVFTPETEIEEISHLYNGLMDCDTVALE